MPALALGLTLAALGALGQLAPQYPSPMSDSTRPHPRVERYDAPGRRAALALGTLYLPPAFDPAKPFPLIVHFHGAPWLVEHHVRERFANAALVTIQIGSGSRVYADAFVEPARFGTLLADVSSRLAELTGAPAAWTSITLSSFSAGYGAIRSILKQPGDFQRVGAVILADSLHASYIGDAAAPRSADLPVDETALEPFVQFARAAAGGTRRMCVTHSEVYPGTYASTTETANALLRGVSLARSPVLKPGPIGMQQLSAAVRSGFHVAGYAGNSAPDHMDHLYALGEFLACRHQP
jgi:hypothetical protein